MLVKKGLDPFAAAYSALPSHGERQSAVKMHDQGSQDVGREKPNTKEYMVSDSIYRKLNIGQD